MIKRFIKKWIFRLLILGVIVGFISHFINQVFIWQLTPFVSLYIRLLIGIILFSCTIFAAMMSGRGIFGNTIAVCFAIPAIWCAELIFLKWSGFTDRWIEFNFSLRLWIAYWFISGLLTAFLILKYSRRITDFIQRTMDKWTQRSLPRVQDTETLYKEHDSLITTPYNPENYWKLDEGQIFLSMTVGMKPIYMKYTGLISESHQNCTGGTRMGKNVAIQQMSVQLILLDELVLMCDAKSGGDDKMSMVLYKYCKKYNKNYNYIELSLSAPYQFNILQIKDVDFLKQILMQLAKLGETNDMAVGHHLGKDDAIAQKLAFYVANEPGEVTISDIMHSNLISKFFELKAKEPSTLQTALIKLADKNCINAKNGFKYEDIITGGGACYVQAKTRDDNVILSVIISSMRFVRAQKNLSRIITVVADEFQKYGGTQDFIDTFTEGAGKGFKLITAYQTSALLDAKAVGKTSEQMLSVIMSNCRVEYLYGTRDPLVLDVFEEQYCGTKIRNEETKDMETSLALADKSTGNKKIKEVLVPRYPKELLTKLRKGEHFLYRTGELMELCYCGYLPLPQEGSDEYNELLKQARQMTLIAAYAADYKDVEAVTDDIALLSDMMPLDPVIPDTTQLQLSQAQNRARFD